MKKMIRSVFKRLVIEVLEALQTVRPEQLHALADKLAAGDVDTSGIDDKAADVLRFFAKNMSLVTSLLRGLENLLEDDTP